MSVPGVVGKIIAEYICTEQDIATVRNGIRRDWGDGCLNRVSELLDAYEGGLGGLCSSSDPLKSYCESAGRVFSALYPFLGQRQPTDLHSSAKLAMIDGIKYDSIRCIRRALLEDQTLLNGPFGLIRESSLHFAAKSMSDVSVFDFLISRGADMRNKQGDCLNLPLHVVLDYLSSAGYNVNGGPRRDRATRIISCLIQHKYDVNTPDESGDTPLHFAVNLNFDLAGLVTRQLIAANADVNAIRKMAWRDSGMTVLCSAVTNYVDSFSDPDEYDNDRFGIISDLLANGAKNEGLRLPINVTALEPLPLPFSKQDFITFTPNTPSERRMVKVAELLKLCPRRKEITIYLGAVYLIVTVVSTVFFQIKQRFDVI